MELDRAIARLLGLDADHASVVRLGSGANNARVAKISASASDARAGHDDIHVPRRYFLKTASGPTGAGQVEGEHASLEAIHAVVPGMCPAPLGRGRLESDPAISFLVTSFITAESSGRVSDGGVDRVGLARDLARLHSAPAPVPAGHSQPQFGFPVTTYCGVTPLDNTFKPSWADFFANNRLRAILRRCEERQAGTVFTAFAAFADLVERTASVVVPRLLADGHLGGADVGIVPVVVHGDLWSGNAARGAVVEGGPARDLVFDPSSFYAHSEYELGIMNMFGGFDARFMAAYHDLCPKTEPAEEYDDRVALYELFHHLNHFAIFGKGYRHGAESIMKRLLAKYASED